MYLLLVVFNVSVVSQIYLEKCDSMGSELQRMAEEDVMLF